MKKAALEKQNEILRRSNDKLIYQVKELRGVNLDKLDEICTLEAENKKLHDELQLEKAINRRLRNTIKNISEDKKLCKCKKNDVPTLVEDAYISSDQIIPREVITGMVFERPKYL